MLERFLNYIDDNQLIKKGDRVLLAVSGGIDSMVMTDLFMRAGITIGIAHCNFSLRGKESDKDEELVRNYALKHKIDFHSKNFDTKGYAKRSGISTQMAARDLRYAWFEGIRQSAKYDCIAIAHNLNDNIETILINLIRGTGISGLSGIKPYANHIIRPILFATRNEIASYCKERRIAFREDRTNAETKYTRNKIRHKVIPVLKEINPSVELTFGEFSVKIAEAERIITSHIDSIRDRIRKIGKEEDRMPVEELKKLQGNTTIIYELFKPYGISGPLTDDLISIFGGRSGKQVLTATHRIVKDRKDIIIRMLGNTSFTAITVNSLNELKKTGLFKSCRKIRIGSEFSIPADRTIACIDYEKIKFPLTIRKWENGDVFCPLGMNRKKKLSDFFIDRKYSIHQKENAIVIESDGRIVWVVGERLDNRFRITASSETALIIDVSADVFPGRSSSGRP